MPIFDYQCNDCAAEFEFFIVRSDDEPSCPRCASVNLTKQASGFTVGHSDLKDKNPSAATGETESKGHTCTSSCNHGNKSGGHDHSKGPYGGCARSYADHLREKYG